MSIHFYKRRAVIRYILPFCKTQLHVFSVSRRQLADMYFPHKLPKMPNGRTTGPPQDPNVLENIVVFCHRKILIKMKNIATRELNYCINYQLSIMVSIQISPSA